MGALAALAAAEARARKLRRSYSGCRSSRSWSQHTLARLAPAHRSSAPALATAAAAQAAALARCHCRWCTAEKSEKTGDSAGRCSGRPLRRTGAADKRTRGSNRRTVSTSCWSLRRSPRPLRTHATAADQRPKRTIGLHRVGWLLLHVFQRAGQERTRRESCGPAPPSHAQLTRRLSTPRPACRGTPFCCCFTLIKLQRTRRPMSAGHHGSWRSQRSSACHGPCVSGQCQCWC